MHRATFAFPSLKPARALTLLHLENLSFRRTRSGTQFSEYYTVTKAGFDLDELLAAARQRSQTGEDPPDEAEPTGAYAGSEWEDEEDEPVDPAPHTPTPSPQSSTPSSPLSSPPPSPKPPPSRPAPLGKRTRTPEKTAARRVRRKRFPSPPLHQPHEPRAPVIGPNAYKRAKKLRSRLSREKQRQRQSSRPKLPTLKRAAARRIACAETIVTVLELDDMPVTQTAYTAKRGDPDDGVYALDDLIGPNAIVPGMTLVDWKGKKAAGLVVPDGRCFGVLGGQPDDPEYRAGCDHLADEIQTWGDRVTFPKDSCEHRRGNFRAEAYGWSHGGGQQQPGILCHSSQMTKILIYLVGLTAMTRIAHFASSVFAAWAPELWLYYAAHLAILLKNNPGGAPNFARSVWACITINFGPQTVTFKHRDFGNLSFGWCAITALGRFNPDRGGHLILWECGLVIPFPPGSTILIPSAIISHSNTSIAEGETRYSVTQYTSGSIFRWVDHGCQLDEKFFASLNDEELADALSMNKGRWDFGSHLWATVNGLKARAARVVERATK